MKNVLSTIILFGVWANLIAQTPFNKVYDFNGKYAQLHGESLAEIDGIFYTAGVSINASDSIEGIRDLCVASFDSNGEALNNIVWHNDIPAIQNSVSGNNEYLLYKDHIYYGVESHGANRPCIIKVNKELTILERYTCIEDGRSQLLFPTSMTEFPEDHIIIPLLNEQTKIEQLVARVSLLDSTDWIIKDLTVPGQLTFPAKAFKVPGEDKVILAGLYAELINGQGQNPDNKIGLYLTTIDSELNVLDRTYLFDNINSVGPDMDGLINDKGEIIMTMKTFDRPLWNATFQSKRRPAVVKLNPDLTVAWNKPFSRREYGDSTEQHVAIIETHNKDGYIITGYSTWENYGMIGRIDLNGDSVWHYKVKTLYEQNNNLLRDVVRTSDGNYLASGLRSVYTVDDSLSSFVQLWLLKFDENGQVVDVGTTATEEIKDSESGITIYPNPASDIIYIKQETPHRIKYDFFDNNGRLLHSKWHTEGSQILFFEVADYPNGIYQLIASDKTGSIKEVKKIVIQH
ncbi:T9SS type A sorting domain-containing protein [Saprospiraceae bacterium]|nr:T9SS type A sorting domain-containing protein [Saprospiraceae bacterium]